jgi:hypothetical protein
MKISVGNGTSVFFWTDRWLHGKSIQHIVPTVFAAMRPRRRMATVAEALSGYAWVQHISRAATMQLVIEVAALYDVLDQVEL